MQGLVALASHGRLSGIAETQTHPKPTESESTF